MKFIKISNKGELDLRLISLMGASTKRDSSGKIGKFGTGLKYSIAWLIRNNVMFKLFIGSKEVKFGVSPIQIRDQDFSVVEIDGKESSLTTSMGLDWKAWMILRELYCNAKDEEEGFIADVTEEPEGREGYTTFYIQHVGDLAETREKWEHYFPSPSKILQSHKEFDIYPGGKTLKIYKQGVLVREIDEPAVFNYDIKDCDINELREYNGYAPFDIARVVAKLDRERIEVFLKLINEKMYEANLSYTWSGVSFQNTWKETIGEAKIISKRDYDNLSSLGQKLDTAKILVVPDKVSEILCYHFPQISAVVIGDQLNSFYEVYDETCNLQLGKALAILGECNYDIPGNANFRFGIFGDPMCMGRVNITTGDIMLSSEHVRKSLFEIITTIIEEVEHLKTGLQDETRGFQQHFINLYTKMLLNSADVEL